MSLKSKLRQVPALRSLWRKVKVAREAVATYRALAYDGRRYTRWWHGVGDNRTRMQQEHALLKAYHGIEKGLSLSAPRPGFGQPKIRAVMEQTDAFLRNYGPVGAGAGAISALQAYRDFNRALGVDVAFVEDWLKDRENLPGLGGTKPTTRAALQAQIDAGFDGFMMSRHSLRQFGPDRVPAEDIREAVRIAAKAPSVCNRQGARVHVFEDAMQALKWQPGNKGFGDLASHGMVITVDLQAFSSVGERNQAWVDGGLFAMALMYALHGLGHGSCPLAWSQPPDYDRKTRKALGIPDNEVIIMMLAVGTVPEELNVAISQRLDIDQFLIERPAS